MKGLFIPEITAEMFRNGCLESIEALIEEGEIYDIEYPLEQEPKTGHWIMHLDDLFPLESEQECSICHARQSISIADDNYCPNCGCRMESEGGDFEE